MNSQKNNLDDLTVIMGIGPARQRWLKESLDVHTFADLAALSVGEIESRLRADKQIASRERIEVWIAEADRRTPKAKRTERRTRTAKDAKAKAKIKASTAENEASSSPLQSVEGDDGGKAHSPTGRDGWKPFASFVVEYQERAVEGHAIEYRTTAHHMESDTGTNWPGIEGEKHCRWMLEQLGDGIPKGTAQEPVKEEQPAQEQPVQPIPIARLPVKVEIAQIRAFQPPQADNPVGSGRSDQPFEGHLRGNAPFALEILFELVGESAAELAEERAVFRARAYVQDQSTGKSIHLGDIEPGKLVKGKLSYAGMVPHITLPPGIYSLFATVTLQAGSVTPDFVTLPEFKVVR
jgi:hypothetical protein